MKRIIIGILLCAPTIVFLVAGYVTLGIMIFGGEMSFVPVQFFFLTICTFPLCGIGLWLILNQIV